MRDLPQELMIVKMFKPEFSVPIKKDALIEYLDRAIAAEAALAEKTKECERLNLVLNERVADINAVLDDNESHRAMKLATDLAFMEQRKQIEQYRQALNRVLPLINDCPYNHGLTNGIDDCAADDIYEACNKCWKIALGVEESD